MLKSLTALMNGEKVVFVVPKNLKPMYTAFKRKYKHLGKCKITNLESFSGRFLRKFKKYALFIDESHCFLGDYASISSQNDFVQKSQKFSDRSDCFVRLIDYAANHQTAKIIIAFSSAHRFDSQHFANKIVGKHYDVIFGAFQILYLKSVMRGTTDSHKITTSHQKYQTVAL